jgi:hypothetical protein
MLRAPTSYLKKLSFGAAAGLTVLVADVAKAQEPAEPPLTSARVDEHVELLGDLLRESESAAPEGLNAAERVSVVQDGKPAGRGRWRATPHLDLRGTYDDNIFIRQDHKTEDYILTLAPGMAVGFWEKDADRERYLERDRPASIVQPAAGNFWMADYTAILLGFAKTHSQNTLDHDGVLRGRWEQAKYTLQAAVHLESKSETNTEVGGRIRRKTLTAEATATYLKTEKTALGLTVFNRTNDPQDYVQTVETRAEAFVQYAPTPLLRFGLVGGAGVVNVESGADQIYERVLGRAAYSLTEKVEAELRGGVEFRQSSGAVGDRTNPIFELRTTWTPAAGTQIALEAFRRVETSIERPEQNIAFTGVAIRFHRQLRGGLHGLLAGGYEVSDYMGTATDRSREDGYYFVRPGLLYNFAEWGNASVTYEHRANDSNQAGSSFGDNQTSVQVSVAY